ncbi:MAG: NADH-quinone oxidoreductase subunit F [Planctomycetes bacterium]|nr:NADH-quinone oxidoreductase subunit F [Planctomycetota bacterium]
MTGTIVLAGATGSREDLKGYRAAGGYSALDAALRSGGSAILSVVEESGLRGHGGAAFPVGRKWRLAGARAAASKHVVANGGEHEPGSAKDKYLVEHHPHRVIEGMLLCGLATGASHGWLYLIEDMVPQIESAEHAIAEARAAGLLGSSVLGSGFTFDVTLHRAPPTYVAGEETAAIDAIEGGAGKPRKKPPYPGESGVRAEPTTVNNVETLANVPWIVRYGAAAYRAIGTGESPGTMLFTLPEELRRPGVVEVPFGTTWRTLLESIGGGVRDGRKLRAIHPALSCGFLDARHLDVGIAHETLRPLGTAPGCGGLRLVLEGDDVVARLLEIAQFFMREQCGQCPPCRMETNQFVHVLQAVRAGKGGDFAAPIRKVADFARKKGLCSLIEMAAAPILSALELFADDLARAARGGV